MEITFQPAVDGGVTELRARRSCGQPDLSGRSCRVTSSPVTDGFDSDSLQVAMLDATAETVTSPTSLGATLIEFDHFLSAVAIPARQRPSGMVRAATISKRPAAELITGSYPMASDDVAPGDEWRRPSSS